MIEADCIVCGGGLAGLAAATVLAENGKKVIVIEKETFLGGRAGSFSDTLKDGTSFQMERGFHAFFRQYYNLRDLMRRVDPTLSMLEQQQDYPVLGPNGAVESFLGLPKKSPLNVVSLVHRTSTLGLLDLMKVSKSRAAAMLSFGPHTYKKWDGFTARDYLDSLRFPPEARQMLFEVFSHSFFNPEEEFSAAELLMQFHFYFMGNEEGLIFDTMRVPFGRGLFEPLQAYLEELGVEFQLGSAVHSVEPSGASYVVTTEDVTYQANACVMALSVPALKQVVSNSRLGSDQWRTQVESLDVTWPFVVWRLWLDKKVHPDRAPFAGTVGPSLLDNISVFEKLEDESAAYTQRHGGSVVELHAYSVPVDATEEEVRRSLLDGLHTHYPETRDAQILEERYLHRRDCPSFAPGSHALRPGVTTGAAGLMLAGDFVKMEQPSALMERAVTSGYQAANHILQTEAQEVRSIPGSGMLAKLRL